MGKNRTPMAKIRTWKPLSNEHKDELISLIIHAYILAQRTPSMKKLAANLIKAAGWRWTADAVATATGDVTKDAVKYDMRYLPHTANAALVSKQYPKERSKRLRHEHTYPLGLLAENVFNLESGDRDVIREMFNIHCKAAIVTREEDQQLSSAKLRSAMPPKWGVGGDLLARYYVVGIELLPPSLGWETHMQVKSL